MVCWQRPSAKETVFVAYGRCHPLDKIFFSPDEIFVKQVDEIPDRSLAVMLSLPGLHSSVRLQVIAHCRETQTQGDTGRNRETQRDTERHRHRETQGHPTSQTLKPGHRHWIANRDLTPCPEIIKYATKDFFYFSFLFFEDE